MSALPVVRIVHEPSAPYGGFLEINESDFDPKKHTLFDPEKHGGKQAKAEKGGKGGKAGKANEPDKGTDGGEQDDPPKDQTDPPAP